MSTETRIANVLLLVFSLIMLAGCRKVDPPFLQRTSTVSLESYHKRSVIALGHRQGFSLSQSSESRNDNCDQFTLYDLRTDSSKRVVALKTCYGGFVTAPDSGSSRADWLVWQDPVQGDCAHFVLEPQDNGRYAFKTCADRYLTAGDAGSEWPGLLQWAIVGETSVVSDWEKFIMKTQP